MRRQLTPLNSYVVDFFEHGDYELTLTQNNLRDGQAWHAMKAMQILLKSIRRAVRKISDLTDRIKEKQAEHDREKEAKLAQYQGLKKVAVARKGAIRGLEDMYEYYDETERRWKRIKMSDIIGKDKTVEESLDYADQVVQAFCYLHDEFARIFGTIVPIGPVSNYQQGTEKLLQSLD